MGGAINILNTVSQYKEKNIHYLTNLITDIVQYCIYF